MRWKCLKTRSSKRNSVKRSARRQTISKKHKKNRNQLLWTTLCSTSTHQNMLKWSEKKIKLSNIFWVSGKKNWSSTKFWIMNFQFSSTSQLAEFAISKSSLQSTDRRITNCKKCSTCLLKNKSMSKCMSDSSKDSKLNLILQFTKSHKHQKTQGKTNSKPISTASQKISMHERSFSFKDHNFSLTNVLIHWSQVFTI
jgi:hypothetical protein